MIALRQAHDPAGFSAFLHTLRTMCVRFAGKWRISRHLKPASLGL
jgi:hypothetical protein